MRIISGTLKGKPIAFIKSAITRPLKDSVKENIFNIIAHSNLLDINLNKSNILDLYSGVGSFGLECVSRGSDKVIFVERNKNAAEILNTNLLTLSIKDKAEVMNEKIIDFLKYRHIIQHENYKSPNKNNSFNFIFIIMRSTEEYSWHDDFKY